MKNLLPILLVATIACENTVEPLALDSVGPCSLDAVMSYDSCVLAVDYSTPVDDSANYSEEFIIEPASR